MASLKVKRAPVRAAFTRTLNDLETEIGKPERNLDLIKRLKKRLEDRFITLEKIDEELDRCMQENDATEEEFTAEYNSVIEYRDKYGDVSLVVDGLDRLDLEQNNIEHNSRSSNGSLDTIITNRNSRSKYKLPKLELTKFNGDPINWLQFWSQFKAIHEEATITNEEKFQYLLQATVEKSPARQVVTSFPPTSENYPKAIDYLKSRFGKDNLLVEVYVRELLKLVLNNTEFGATKEISSIYDRLEMQLRRLESLGVAKDKYAAMLYPLIESALPEEVLKAWQRSRSQIERNEDDQLSPLLKFLRNEVDSEIRLKLAKTSITGDVDQLADISESILDVKESVCFFCKRSGHMKQNCRHYKKWLTKHHKEKHESRNEESVNLTMSVKEKEFRTEKEEEFLF